MTDVLKKFLNDIISNKEVITLDNLRACKEINSEEEFEIAVNYLKPYNLIAESDQPVENEDIDLNLDLLNELLISEEEEKEESFSEESIKESNSKYTINVDSSENLPSGISNYNMYIKSLETVDTSTLTREQELELMNRVKTGDKEAMNEMVCHNLRLVISIASYYAAHCNLGTLEFDDLIQEGNTGLMIALEKFNPDYGYKFSTYASFWIKQKITKSIYSDSRTIRVPIYVVGLVFGIHRFIRARVNETGTEPSLKEITEYANTTIKSSNNGKKLPYTEEDISKIMEGCASHGVVSLEKPVGEEEDSIFGDFLPDEDTISPDRQASLNTMAENVRIAVETVLTEREKFIIVNRFGLYGHTPKRLEDLSKVLGVTKERVRQIEAKAKRKMRKTYSSKVLLEGFAEDL